MKASKEGDLVRACLGLLHLRGIPAWRNNTGATKIGRRFIRFGHKGSSDILGVIPPTGRLLAIEAKMPGEKPTPDQRAFLDAVSAAGGLALCLTDVVALDVALRMEGIE